MCIKQGGKGIENYFLHTSRAVPNSIQSNNRVLLRVLLTLYFRQLVGLKVWSKTEKGLEVQKSL